MICARRYARQMSKDARKELADAWREMRAMGLVRPACERYALKRDAALNSMEKSDEPAR